MHTMFFTILFHALGVSAGSVPPFWNEVIQEMLGGNQQLGDTLYWWVEWVQIALLILVVVGTGLFFGIMALKIYLCGDDEKRKKLKLSMYKPVHALGLITLSLVSTQFIWNILVPTIWVYVGGR